MVREKRIWHPKFMEYMESIKTHVNYQGMPQPIKTNGSIRWDTFSGKAKKDRLQWWENKARELEITTTDEDWKSKVSKGLHPTKRKKCQICGTELSLEYVYPSKRLANKINKIPELQNELSPRYCIPIKQLIHILVKNYGDCIFENLTKIFSIPPDIEKNELAYYQFIYDNFVVKESGLFSPGAMSNCPDRFDGFHSDNLCCRQDSDIGRHTSNMIKYGEDRRAYEHWSDGDWKSSSRLMKTIEPGICVICEREGDNRPKKTYS